MENEIRIFNGKKQVKKGRLWRPCCLREKCTNRTDTNHGICKTCTKLDKIKIINEQISKKKMQYLNVNLNPNYNDLLFPGIYLYIFPDNKKYVGQTTGNILNRTWQHINDAYKNYSKGCTILDNKLRDLMKVTNDGKLPKNKKIWEEIFYKKVSIIVLEKIEKNDLSDNQYKILLNKKEMFYIKKYKCYKNSKEYDGNFGLNCLPGDNGSEMKPRNKNNCYDHNGKLLKRGIESLVIKDKIVGYKSRLRGKYENSISIGNNYNLTLDKKLEIAYEFQKIKITSVESEKKILNDFKKKYKLKIFNSHHKISNEKIDHTGKKLKSGIFYNNDKKEYRLSIRRKGTITEIIISQNDCDSLDEQKKEALILYNKISKINLNSQELINKPFTELKKYVKSNKLPIITSLYQSRFKLLKIIEKYQNIETKQEVINKFNNFKKWHDAPNLPKGWKRMWGSLCLKDNKCKDYGHFTYKNPHNIIFYHEKIAKDNINSKLPDFEKIINNLPKNLNYHDQKKMISKYLWKKTKGWRPHINNALWNCNYKLFKNHIKKNDKSDTNYNKLKSWKYKQIKNYKMDKLSQDKINKLESITGWSWV
jgi:hypothetical protein